VEFLMAARLSVYVKNFVRPVAFRTRLAAGVAFSKCFAAGFSGCPCRFAWPHQRKKAQAKTGEVQTWAFWDRGDGQRRTRSWF